jgi:hypothetical protein
MFQVGLGLRVWSLEFGAHNLEYQLERARCSRSDRFRTAATVPEVWRPPPLPSRTFPSLPPCFGFTVHGLGFRVLTCLGFRVLTCFLPRGRAPRKTSGPRQQPHPVSRVASGLSLP